MIWNNRTEKVVRWYIRNGATIEQFATDYKTDERIRRYIVTGER